MHTGTAGGEAVDWREVTTVAEVVQAYPDRMQSLIEALDLERPELSAVRAAYERGDLVAACEALLAHYRHGDTAAWLRQREGTVTDGVREVAEDAVNDRFHQQGTVARVPRDEAGRLDWLHEGPLDDLQFAVFLNRHQPFPHLVTMWKATGDVKYVEAVDRLVRDWVLQYGQAPNGAQPHAVWTPLNPGIRMSGPWPVAFYGLQDAEAFTPAARLLLLSTVPEHARFLQKHLRRKHNFATMQMNGLGTMGLTFPEFKQANHWVRFALNVMLDELDHQFYPDGVQKELTWSYHWVSLVNFDRLAQNMEAAGREVPRAYHEALERMYHYLAYSMRPDGTGPLNNDSSLWDRREAVRRAAERFGRPDLAYIATNGAEGERPAGPGSRFFPWAGQLIARSGWDADAAWSFFDVGPFGVSHQHNDMLHLSITLGQRLVLVDSGRFAYQGRIADKFRQAYALHSRGHNVILLDGLGQQANATETDRPHVLHHVSEGMAFAFGELRAGFDGRPIDALSAWALPVADRVGAEQAGRHARAVIYLPQRGWIVVDRVRSPGGHRLEPLWHFHPDCTVQRDGLAVLSTDADETNLRITPAGEMDWQLSLVQGREKPTPQGWFSATYNDVKPATCAVYEGSMRDEALFGWVITPGQGRPAPVDVQWHEAPAGVARLTVTWPDATTTRATVVMDERGAVPLGDGRTLVGRALVETEGEAPQVACGWLRDASGQVLAADPLPAEAALADLADHLSPVLDDADNAGPETGTQLSWRLPLANARFERPLQLRLAPQADTAAGWRVTVSPDSVELAPGDSAVVRVVAEALPAAKAYPALTLSVSAALLDASGQAGETATFPVMLPILAQRSALAVARAAGPPTIDGRLDESLWRRVPTVPHLGSMAVRGETPAEPGTAVWMVYDDAALYVAFRCAEPNPAAILARATTRDGDVYSDDAVELMLATGDEGTAPGRDYLHVVVNPKGTIYDGRGRDGSFDAPGLAAAAQVAPEGEWTVEVVIPWTDLGLGGPPATARALVARTHRAGPRHDTVQQFPISRRGNHEPHRFIPLRFEEQAAR